MYLLLAFTPPLIPFYLINNISISVTRCNLTLVFFQDASHATPDAERN